MHSEESARGRAREGRRKRERTAVAAEAVKAVVPVAEREEAVVVVEAALRVAVATLAAVVDNGRVLLGDCRWVRGRGRQSGESERERESAREDAPLALCSLYENCL